MVASPITLFEFMITCGVTNVSAFDGQTATKQIATDIFTYDFSICINKYFEDLDANLNS